MYKIFTNDKLEFSKLTLYPEFDFPGDDSDGFNFYSCSFNYSSSLWYLLNNLLDNTSIKNYEKYITDSVYNKFYNTNIDEKSNNYANYINQENLLSASSISGSFVLDIKQQYVGYRIKEGTFSFTDLVESRVYSDDGDGNIISGSTTIGNIFYEQGLVAIYDNIYTGSGQFTFEYSCINDIYEQSWNCTVDESEFNASTNPTSYISGSQIIKNVGAVYFTTIGLYNSYNELIATARLANPLKRDSINDISIKIKMDL